MSRYETRCLTLQYFSLPGIRLAPGTWAYVGFRVSRYSPSFFVCVFLLFYFGLLGKTALLMRAGLSEHYPKIRPARVS